MVLHQHRSKSSYWIKLNGDILRILVGAVFGFGLGFYTCWVLLR